MFIFVVSIAYGWEKRKTRPHESGKRRTNCVRELLRTRLENSCNPILCNPTSQCDSSSFSRFDERRKRVQNRKERHIYDAAIGTGFCFTDGQSLRTEGFVLNLDFPVVKSVTPLHVSTPLTCKKTIKTLFSLP